MKTIIAYSAELQDKSIRLISSDGRTLFSERWEDVAGFLLQPCDFAVVYHIDKFFNIISTLLPKKAVDTLRSGERVYTEDNRKLYYQVGRMLGVNATNLYGLSKYSEKEITDADELLKLAYEVVEAYRYFGVETTKLTSPVAVYEEVLDRVPYPRACDLPDNALSILDACSKAAWVEWRDVFKLGHWKANEINDYDVVACYPSLISKLPDISKATFFEVDTLPDDGEYSWGEMIGDLRITQDVTPFGYVGEQEMQITTGHLRLINKYEWGEFKFKHGWFFKLPERYSFPFRKTMQTLYEARSNQNLLVQLISKGISVGIGGKLVHRKDSGELGINNNVIYGRLITSACAIKVADMIWKNGLSKDIISIKVDGFLAENNGINLDLGDGGMGSWRINPPTPFLVASQNYQWGEKRHPNGKNYLEMTELIKKSPKSAVIGGVDLNLLDYSRNFKDRPRNGQELLDNKYSSLPSETIY